MIFQLRFISKHSYAITKFKKISLFKHDLIVNKYDIIFFSIEIDLNLVIKKFIATFSRVF